MIWAFGSLLLLFNNMIKVGILNFGFGNLKSITNAFEFIKQEYSIITNPSKEHQLDECTHLLLPGVGSFAYGVSELQKFKLKDYFLAQVNNGKPILGICLGMQLLFESSTEDGLNPGLSFCKGECECFTTDKNFNGTLPHVGYSQIHIDNKSDSLWSNINESSPFYFVHTYRVSTKEICSYQNYAIARHGNSKFIAYVRADNIIGVQFHPEKSQLAGLQFLKNFCRLPIKE